MTNDVAICRGPSQYRIRLALVSDPVLDSMQWRLTGMDVVYECKSK